MKQVIITLVTLFIIASCKKDQPITLLTSDFPIKVGNTWTYLRVDSGAGVVKDTLNVSIVGITTFQSKQVYLWVESSKFKTDTLYLSAAGDTITIFNPFSNVNPFCFVFPIENGSHWLSNINGYNTCTSISTQSINGVNYPDVYTLSRVEHGIDYQVNEYLGVVKGVGIVTDRVSIQALPGAKYQWTLLRYHLN